MGFNEAANAARRSQGINAGGSEGNQGGFGGGGNVVTATPTTAAGTIIDMRKRRFALPACLFLYTNVFLGLCAAEYPRKKAL
jgi:hypothetical protein